MNFRLVPPDRLSEMQTWQKHEERSPMKKLWTIDSDDYNVSHLVIIPVKSHLTSTGNFTRYVSELEHDVQEVQ